EIALPTVATLPSPPEPAQPQPTPFTLPTTEFPTSLPLPVVTVSVVSSPPLPPVPAPPETPRQESRQQTVETPMPVNTAPTLTLPVIAQTGREDAALAIQGIRVNDAEATILALTLQVEHGALSLADSSGLSFSQGNGTASQRMSMIGSKAALNAALTGLSYLGDADYFGPDTLALSLDDLGATGTGGAMTTRANLAITLEAVNDPPSFTMGSNQSVIEDAGPITVAGWATALSAGPANEAGQTLTFSVNNSNSALFRNQPAIDRTGTLTFTPADHANGSATLSVALLDSGEDNNTSATQTVTITVTPVNDTPSFLKGADQSILKNDGAQSIAGWATGISRGGGADEASQTLTFTLVNDNNALFAAQPAIDASGTLTYTPATNAFGSATVSVSLADNWGGDNTTPTQGFQITIGANSRPTLTTNTGASVFSGGTTVISSARLAASDAETAAGSLVHTITTAPTHGTLTKSGTQLRAGDTFTKADLDGYTLWYNHDGLSTTSDAFTFSVSDGTDSLSNRTFAFAVSPSTLPGPHAATSGGELFLGGNYIELGIAALGSFGTSGAKPAGFTGTSVRTRVGMSFDHDGFTQGSSSAIDFFLPGTPEERWTAGYYSSGTPHIGTNSTLAGGADITMNALTNTSSGNTLSATVSGTLTNTLQIQQAICFDVNARFFRNVVTLTNVSGATIDQVRFMRSFDPDNTVDVGGGSATVNTVVYQEATKSLVRAQSSPGDAYQTLTGTQATILYYSDDTRAQVAAYSAGYAGSTTDGKTNDGFSIRNIYDSGVYDTAPAAGTSYTADKGISITFDVGSLASNASATFTYYTSLDNRDVGSVIASINAWGGDPLVLDLDGNGLELTSASSAPVRFDMNADGLPDTTGWVGGNDGLLVMDRNQNGKIDDIREVISEYFAPGTSSSLAALATLDDNRDQRVDGADAAFGQLQLLRADGSLSSLAEDHITALRLHREDPSGESAISGNRVTGWAGFETVNGAGGAMAEVGFAHESGGGATPGTDAIQEGLQLLGALGAMLAADQSFAENAPPPPDTLPPPAWTIEHPWPGAGEADPWHGQPII
ncbi:MAG: hypothetical protein HQL96_17460, partial [Magnetococcales bacterium]|nr:hypothetical protein [Magnetococcales bacterium]